MNLGDMTIEQARDFPYRTLEAAGNRFMEHTS